MSESRGSKRVRMAATSNATTASNNAPSRSTSTSTSTAPKRRSMGPRQQSLPAFTPDNYSSDEDDKFLHENETNDAPTPKESATNNASDNPGDGWTNGAIPPSITLHPYTRSGRLSLFSHHRRWINFQSSWSRIGKDATEMDAIHSQSASGSTLMTGCLAEEAKTVRALIAQLCECFYKHGWATGTGGGVSIRVGGPKENRPYRVFVAPSGVQKEDMVGDDVFELDMDKEVVAPPKTPNLRQSACTPLWYVVYKHVPSAMCVIHTHSMHAQLATLLDPKETSSVLRVTHLEMLKGVGNHSYDDILEIPIIDNRPTEDLLAEQLESVIVKYPKCNAVLVRRHGVYVWGDSWEQAKAQCESFDYLFESVCKMRQMGLDAGVVPDAGTYRDEEERVEAEEGPAKKQKTVAVAPAFNGASSADNDVDLECNASTTTIPLLPRDAKHLLLDIEGTTTSISFVKDVLFPYVLDNLEEYAKNMNDKDVHDTTLALLKDMHSLDDCHPAKLGLANESSPLADMIKNPPQKIDEIDYVDIICMVKNLMREDVKATGLKSLQGKMWKSGYASGELIGHLYSDFMPLLTWCQKSNVKVSIYSSGSIAAQKLLFAHTAEGDLTPHFHAHFDTTSGGKKESSSYATIAKELGVDRPEEVVFVSDLEAEVRAARDAGMMAVVAVRPGNVCLSEDVKKEFPVVRSLLQLCGSD